MRAKRRAAPWRAPIMLGALVAAAGLHDACAQEIAILYHEQLQRLTVVEAQETPQLAGAPPVTGPSLSFVAFGRQFDMALSRNLRLTRALRPEQLAAFDGVELYDGGLTGQAQSWVRLTRTGTTLSGVIFDGAELYAIEPFARVAPYLATPGNAQADEPVIYRWSDTALAATDSSLGGAAAAAVPRSKDLESLATELKAAISPGRQLDIGLVADAAFIQQQGAESAAALLNVANVVDGIFVTQVGVHLNVAEVELLAGAPQVLPSLDPDLLLEQLESHKVATPALRDLGLVHLFVGRDLSEPAGSPAGVQILGAANIGSLCETRSVGVTQAIDVFSAALVAAHEIGHNFGARHDGVAGLPCESAVGAFLMNPRLEGHDTLSQCSIDSMLPEIAAASCVYDIQPNDLSVHGGSAPTQALLGSQFDVDVVIASNGIEDALGIAVDFAVDGTVVYSVEAPSPRFRCRINLTPIPPECTLHYLESGQTLTVRARVSTPRVGPATVEVRVSSANDPDLSNNAHRFDIDVRPAVDLAITSLRATPPQLRPGEASDLAIDFANHSTIAATNVEAHFRALDAFTVESVAGPRGACRHEFLSTGEWHCPVGTMPPGGTERFAARVRAVPSAMPPGSSLLSHVVFELTATEPDLNSRQELYSYLITPVISDLGVSLTNPAQVEEGDQFQFTVEGRNLGTDTVDGVTIDLEWAGIAIDSVTSSGPLCPAPPYAPNLRCTLDDFGGGATFALTFHATATTPGSHQLFARIRGITLDNDVMNDGALRGMVVAPKPAAPAPAPPPQPAPAPSPQPQPQPTTPTAAASGGGGGGAIDLALLLLLGLAFVSRGVRLHGVDRKRAVLASSYQRSPSIRLSRWPRIHCACSARHACPSDRRMSSF